MKMKNAKPLSSYQIVASEFYLTIRLSGSLCKKTLENFHLKLFPHLQDPYPHVIINFKDVSSFSKDWSSAIFKIHTEVKVFQKGLRIINASPKLREILKLHGVDANLKFSDNLQDALIDLGVFLDKSLNTDFINPFLDATMRVLKVQAKISAEVNGILVKKSAHHVSREVSTKINVKSDSFQGSLILNFSEMTFRNIIMEILGDEAQRTVFELNVSAIEIMNMIISQAKIQLTAKGYEVSTTPPEFITGHDKINRSPLVLVPFHSRVGEFCVEVHAAA